MIKSGKFANNVGKTFKESKPLRIRRIEVVRIREKYPHKIPVVIERYKKEKQLPIIAKTKYLVPREMTMSQFAIIVRNRMNVDSTQAIYFTVNGRNMPCMSQSMEEIYHDNVDEDGFLYINYAAQEMFG